MRTVFLILTLILSQLSKAGEGEFAFSKIPATLLKNANSVVRVDEMHLQIINHGKARMKARFVITVLNEQGDYRATFVESYTKFEKIESVEGYLYDASGNNLRKMKMKDAEDVSGTDDGSLVDDFRIKRHGFFHKVYPYTVEYIYE